MKILYITPKANDFGGVAKILSVKANELAKNHQVHIATQNNGWQNAPYNYDASIQFFDMKLYGTKLLFLYRYHKALNQIIDGVKPDIIFVSDNGLKAYLIPFLVKRKCALVFEVRGSLYNQMKKVSQNKVMSFFLKLKYFYRRKLVSFFDYIVFLSKESQDEWKITKNTFIIPNPLEKITETTSTLEEKTAICVSRNSHEKGLDRLLQIWKLVHQKNQNWTLKIVGIDINDNEIYTIAKQLGIEKSVQILPPTTSILNEYLSSSIYLLPSRSEGFPNVLLEAQSCGLPIIAYNSPIGAKAIVKDSVNGFLIKDGDAVAFAEKLELLFTDKNLREKMGKLGRENSLNFSKEKIISKWENLIEEVVPKI